MEKSQTPPILETELGAKRLALANAQHDVDLNNQNDVDACIRQNVKLMRRPTERANESVTQFLGRKTVQAFVKVKDIAA